MGVARVLALLFCFRVIKAGLLFNDVIGGKLLNLHLHFRNEILNAATFFCSEQSQLFDLEAFIDDGRNGLNVDLFNFVLLLQFSVDVVREFAQVREDLA